MASVNRAIILGNVGKDPEIRYMPNGDASCTLSVATSRNWKNKEGERQEETEWHRVSFFGKLAEIVGEYVKKGKPIYVEGRLRTRKWTDKDGADKYTTEVIAESMQLLGGRDDAEAPSSAPAKSAPPRRSPPPAGYSGTKPAPKSGTGFDDMGDDIPF